MLFLCSFAATVLAASAFELPKLGKYCYGSTGQSISILGYKDESPKYPGLSGSGHMEMDLVWNGVAESSHCTEAFTFSSGSFQLPDTHDKHYDDCLYKYFQKMGCFYSNVEMGLESDEIMIRYMGSTWVPQFKFCGNGTEHGSDLII